MQTAEATEARTRSPFVNGYARWLLLLVLILLAAWNVLRLLPSTVVYGARGAADFSIFYFVAFLDADLEGTVKVSLPTPEPLKVVTRFYLLD